MKRGSFLIGFLILLSIPIFNQTILVTTGEDSISGSLRDAINKANNGAIIIFDKNIKEIKLGEQINIDKSLTISGNPNLVIRDNRWIIDTSNISPALHRFFLISGSNSIVVNFTNLKFNKDQLFIEDTVNYETNGQIILIKNSLASVNIKYCYFTGSSSYGGFTHNYYGYYGQNGGGIAKYGGILNISNCTFANLITTKSFYLGNGGAIYQLSGTTNLINCTFYNNSAGSTSSKLIGYGSSIYSELGDLSIINCTFCENENKYSWTLNSDPWFITKTTSAIFLQNSNLTIQNSIFYNNDGKDITGNSGSVFISKGYNIFDQPIAGSNDFYNINPGFLLKSGYVTLSDKTFWIPVCALDAIGPAIDALPPDGNDAPELDQRGFTRINKPDIGAFEFQGCTPFIMKANWYGSLFKQDSWASEISIANDTVVWIKDSNSDSLSISHNGGVAWIVKTLPSIPGFVKTSGGICAISASKAYYILSVSDLKGVYLTTDTGNTWVRQNSAFNLSNSFPNFVHFWNENDGVTAGDALPNFEIYTTSNGGNQWNRIADANMPLGNNEYTFNSQSSYRIIGNSIYFITSTARIFKSTDRGKTWTVINTPFHNALDSLITFDFKDENIGLVSYCSNDGLYHKVYRTFNGGQTWDSISTNNFHQRLKYMHVANTWLSMNSAGGLSYSCDDGQTWTNNVDFNGIHLMSAAFNSKGKVFFGTNKYIIFSLPVITLSPYYLTIAAPDNSSQIFTIDSNTDWIVTSDNNWLTPNLTNGSGNETITLSAKANPNALERKATITVSGKGISNQEIIVTQAPGYTKNNSIKIEEFKVSPNPTNSLVEIGMPLNYKSDYQVEVYNSLGSKLQSKSYKNNYLCTQIDLSGYPSGIYIFRIKSLNKTHLYKIVKK
jgi:photosystem II stability/assembly factor-like uncharacterized protein